MKMNDNLFDGNSIDPAVVPDEDIINPANDMSDDDMIIGEIFAKKKQEKIESEKSGNSVAQVRSNQQGRQSQTFTAKDVNDASAAITRFLDSGKLSSALDLVFTLKGALRLAVKDTVNVTIPMGSHDNELRQIAAGALIQSYLEQGKIVRRDIEEKLYAIIESSDLNMMRTMRS